MTVLGELGEIPLDIPRYRNAAFEPQHIGNYLRLSARDQEGNLHDKRIRVGE